MVHIWCARGVRIQSAKRKKYFAEEALIKEVSETCNTTLKTLSTIRVGKSNGKEYKEFIKAVEQGSKLSIYDSPELIKKTLEDISEKASDYEYVHSELQAPLSKEGIKRRKEINDMENFANPESIHRAIDEPNLNKIILQTVAMANVTKNVQKQPKGLVK